MLSLWFCYVRGYLTSFMDVCSGCEWKNKEWLILWGFSMCMLCVSVPNRGNIRKKPQNFKGWKMAKQDEDTCQLLVVLWRGDQQFPRRPTSHFLCAVICHFLYAVQMCVIFYVLYFIQKMPSVTGIQSQLSPIMLKIPVVEDWSRAWIQRAQTKFCFYVILLKIFFQRNQNCIWHTK